MVFWIAAALVTVVVIFVVTRPLLRPDNDPTPATASDADLAVYKDQLKEIDADEGRGLIGANEAQSARVEVQRRILQTHRAQTDADGSGPAASRSQAWLYYASALIIPAAALGLYVSVGSPGLPDYPRSVRLKIPVDQLPITEMIARVEARLRERPEDGQGWDIIAPIYLRQGDFPRAQKAYGNAIRILGGSPERLMGFANADVGANRGRVSDDAMRIFQTLVRARPGLVPAHFWIANGHEQRGQLSEARDAYVKVRDATPANSDLHRAALSRLDIIAKQAPSLPSPPPEAVNELGKLSPEARRSRIEGMVAQLDERLREDGSDAEGWQRLIRSYVVLGRRDAAADAVSRARAALAPDKGAIALIEQLATTLALVEPGRGG
ncbi:MAG: c-type cytochrome biogenesis protein CcmI [Pseudomonadota bacterium]